MPTTACAVSLQTLPGADDADDALAEALLACGSDDPRAVRLRPGLSRLTFQASETNTT